MSNTLKIGLESANLTKKTQDEVAAMHRHSLEKTGDTLIIARGYKALHSHRIILVSRSSKMRELMSGEDRGPIYLQQHTYEQLKLVLDLIYGLEVEVEAKDAEQFKRITEYYGLQASFVEN